MQQTKIEMDGPANIEAEQQLLGAILCANDAFNSVSDLLTEASFHDPVHAHIWAVVSGRIRAGHLVSPVTLKHLMENHEGLKQLGGPAYLARMAAAAIAPGAARSYALTLVDAQQRRVMLKAIDGAKSDILAGQDLGQAAATIEIAAQSALLVEKHAPVTSFLAALTKTVDQTFEAYKGNGAGLKTGITALDDLMGGMFPADLIIMAGGPSMGKSSLSLAVAKKVAEAGKWVSINSLEMSEEALAQRILSAETRIPYFRLRSGDLSEAEGRKAATTAMEIQNLPIEISGPHIRDIGAIYAVAKRAKSRGRLDLLIVDYLQLVRAPSKDRFQMVAEVSMGLKALAKTLGVPVIALSQISRDVASREDKRPQLRDLRESAQIEQDADMVIFTHRESYYLEREGAPRGKDGKVRTDVQADHEAALAACKGQMDLILAKHRSGAVGTAKVRCDITTNWFGSLSDPQDGFNFGGGL